MRDVSTSEKDSRKEMNHRAARTLTSVGRMTRRICSIELRSGLRPPCMVKIFSSMMAAMGRQLKQSVNVFHSLMLYLRLPVGQGARHPSSAIDEHGCRSAQSQ